MKVSAEVVVVVVVVFWSSVASATNASTEYSIRALISLYSNKKWMTVIGSVQTITDREPMTENILSVTSAAAFDDDLEEFVFQHLKAAYTALKCKYSDLLITTFYDLFDCAALCSSNDPASAPIDNDEGDPPAETECAAFVAEKLLGFKEYVARMIYNLMCFTAITPSLKSADDTLTKSLISINWYLYGSKTEPDRGSRANNVDVKKAISQMINLIEVFNGKNCYARTADHLKFDAMPDEQRVDSERFRRAVDDLALAKANDFETLLTNSTSVKRILGSNVPEVDATTAYDPESLLLGNVTTLFGADDRYSFFATLRVAWKNDWPELEDVYESVVRSHDVRVAFDYQVLLFEVMKDVFYVKLLDVYVNDEPRSDDDDDDDDASKAAAEAAFEALCRFVSDALPTNYPTSLYGPIVEARDALFYDLRIAKRRDHGGAVFSANTAKLLARKPTIKTWGESNGASRTIAATDVSGLVDAVAGPRFDLFVRTFKLFSHESNTLDDYRVHDGGDRETAASRDDGRLTRLRETLVAFRVLIDGRLTAAAERGVRAGGPGSFGAAARAVRENVECFYETYRDDGRGVGRALLPLLLRFPETEDDPATAERLLATRQTTVLALNRLEYLHAASARGPIVYDRDMYRAIAGDERLLRRSRFGHYAVAAELSAEVLRRAAAAAACPRVDATRQTSSRRSGDRCAGIAEWTLPDVVDYQRLVSAQMVEMKRIVSVVLETLLFAVAVLAEPSSGDGNVGAAAMDAIGRDARRFRDLPFPDSVKTYARGAVDLFLFALEKRDEPLIASWCRTDILGRLEAVRGAASAEHAAVDVLSSFRRPRDARSVVEVASSFHAVVNRLKRFFSEWTDDCNLIDKLEFSSALY